MSRSHRGAALLAAAASLVFLATYLAAWRGVDHFHVGRSDFTSIYVGATLLRQGEGSRLYDETLQAPLHARLIAPDPEGNLPYVNPPAAAVVALPFSLLGLDTAWRLWSLLQLVLLAAAAAIAIRAAPWPAATPRLVRLGAGGLSLAGVGTFNLLLLGQWDGLSALGLAAAYAAWRRGRLAWGGALLAMTAAVAKPHLALGLAVFVVARRDRRLLAGAAAGLVAVVGISLLAAGPSGCAGFLHAAMGSTTRWHLGELLGFTGLFGSWLDDGLPAQALAALAGGAALAACAGLGDAWRRHPGLLEPALAGAVALSLVAAPHLLGHDLTLLAPVAAWSLAAAARRDGLGAVWPGPRGIRVLALWALLNLAALMDISNPRPAPPGRLVPLMLVASGALAWTACSRALRATDDRPAEHRGDVLGEGRPGEEVPLGGVASQ